MLLAQGMRDGPCGHVLVKTFGEHGHHGAGSREEKDYVCRSLEQNPGAETQPLYGACLYMFRTFSFCAHFWCSPMYFVPEPVGVRRHEFVEFLHVPTKNKLFYQLTEVGCPYLGFGAYVLSFGKNICQLLGFPTKQMTQPTFNIRLKRLRHLVMHVMSTLFMSTFVLVFAYFC